MADSSILPMNTRDDALELIGGKGRSLAKMSIAGFLITSLVRKNGRFSNS